MTENTPDFSVLQAEIEADIATLSAIAKVKLATLRQYQRQLLALREAHPPRPRFPRCRLLFECREERRARIEALDTAAHRERYLAHLCCNEPLPF
ncbi:hypothetical protein [Aeromonas enteropelogenes]|uniref:hypothetical protein n=1 Tax=Aeromonas enteropelogenes TaxID=29489 RepID=UPI003BA34E30